MGYSFFATAEPCPYQGVVGGVDKTPRKLHVYLMQSKQLLGKLTGSQLTLATFTGDREEPHRISQRVSRD